MFKVIFATANNFNDSIQVNVFAYSACRSDISISGAPPPEIIAYPNTHTA